MGAPSAPPSCSSSPQCCCNGNYCFKGWTGIFSQPRLQTFIFQPVKMNENSCQILSLISYWPIAEWLSPDELSSVEFTPFRVSSYYLSNCAWVRAPRWRVCLPKTNSVWISAHWSVCVYVCVDMRLCFCVCVWEKKRERKKKRRHCEYACVWSHALDARVHEPHCSSLLMMCNESQSGGSILYHCSLQI